MGLKIKLAPNEVLFIGGAKIQNGSQEADLMITGDDVSVLRQRDRMIESASSTACERLHILIEQMYLSGCKDYYDRYISETAKIENAAPSLKMYIALVSDRVVAGDLYQALKRMKVVLEHEKTLLAYHNGVIERKNVN